MKTFRPVSEMGDRAVAHLFEACGVLLYYDVEDDGLSLLEEMCRDVLRDRGLLDEGMDEVEWTKICQRERHS